MKFEKWLAVTIMNIQDIRSSFIRLFFDALKIKELGDKTTFSYFTLTK